MNQWLIAFSIFKALYYIIKNMLIYMLVKIYMLVIWILRWEIPWKGALNISCPLYDSHILLWEFFITQFCNRQTDKTCNKTQCSLITWVVIWKIEWTELLFVSSGSCKLVQTAENITRGSDSSYCLPTKTIKLAAETINVNVKLLTNSDNESVALLFL